MLHADSTEFCERYPHAVKLYDADGYRIIRAIACDPETGDVIQLSMDSKTGTMQLDPKTGCLAKSAVRYPAPLTIVPNDPPVVA